MLSSKGSKHSLYLIPFFDNVPLVLISSNNSMFVIIVSDSSHIATFGSRKAKCCHVRNGRNIDDQHGHMLSMLAAQKTTLLSKEGLRNYQPKLTPLLKWKSNLDTKKENKAAQPDVKGVLKFLVGVDGETDAMIDEAMEVGAALFVMAAQLTVARILYQNPDKLRTSNCEHVRVDS